jgi:hypothetical protein
MTENNYPLGIVVTAPFKLALERAASADGMSIAQFIETALAGLLADAGYIEEWKNLAMISLAHEEGASSEFGISP